MNQFLDKFGPKIQNYQFKLKFGTETNWIMQNSVVVFTFLGQICSKISKLSVEANI